MMKNGVNCGNGFAIGDEKNTKNCPLFSRLRRKASLLLPSRKSNQMEAHVFKNFFLR